MHTSDSSKTSSSFPKHSQFFRYVRVCRVGIVISFLYVEMKMKVREQFTFFLFRFFFAYISVAHSTSHYQQRPRMVAERKNGSSQRRNAQQEDKKKAKKFESTSQWTTTFHLMGRRLSGGGQWRFFSAPRRCRRRRDEKELHEKEHTKKNTNLSLNRLSFATFPPPLSLSLCTTKWMEETLRGIVEHVVLK